MPNELNKPLFLKAARILAGLVVAALLITLAVVLERSGSSSKSPTPSVEVRVASHPLLGSFFRVVQTQENPFDDTVLIVATESEEISGEGNQGCGGLYVSPTCFFFIEKQDSGSLDSIRFVGYYRDHVASFEPGSIIFKERELIEFQASGGDAGSGVEAVYEFNLRTGESKKIKEEYISAEEGDAGSPSIVPNADQILSLLPSADRAELLRSNMPVLLPPLGELRNAVAIVRPLWYEVQIKVGERTINISGTRPQEGGISIYHGPSDPMRGTFGTVSGDEGGGYSATWSENGIAYLVNVHCERDLEDPACSQDDFVLEIVESLVRVK